MVIIPTHDLNQAQGEIYANFNIALANHANFNIALANEDSQDWSVHKVCAKALQIR